MYERFKTVIQMKELAEVLAYIDCKNAAYRETYNVRVIKSENGKSSKQKGLFVTPKIYSI